MERAFTILMMLESANSATGCLQVKRIHEYKRQLLNVLGIIYRYDNIKQMSPEERKQVGSKPFAHLSYLINHPGCKLR